MAQRRRGDRPGRAWLLAVTATLCLGGAGLIVGGLIPGDDPTSPETTAGVTTPSAPPTPSPSPAPATSPPTAHHDHGAAASPSALTTGPLMASSPPVRLTIPALGVTSHLIDLGLRADGTMQVPADGATAGWYTHAPTPGALGPALIAAHVDWNGEPGLFTHLDTLQPGDQIDVHRADGTQATFTVTATEQHPKAAFPTTEVYGPINHAGLRLITCGGIFDPDADSYEDNIIVFANLTTATSG